MAKRVKKPIAEMEGDTEAQDDEGTDAKNARKPSQAVVIVHGMGEQRPMGTIRGFAEAVWSKDPSLTEGFYGRRKPDPDKPGPDRSTWINKSWIHPDERAKSQELRRITTPYDIHGRRTDFFELYWADVTQGTTLERLKAWIWELLFRKWSDVPRDARKLYIAAWTVVVLIFAPTVALTLMKSLGLEVLIWPGWVWTVAATLITAFVTAFLVPYFGDVAIYVQAAPGTVAKRRDARARGLDLLRGLIDDNRYDRIVLVGHSLGTILAYDLLQILWTEYGPGPSNSRQEPDVLAAFKAVGTKALPIDSKERAKTRMEAAELAEFREMQWRCYALLRDRPTKQTRPWKISDFVTLGSPLTHAEFLVTRNAADFSKAVDERLLATCPPVSETKEPSILYGGRGNPQHPHHAAVFAATRWTNIYDKDRGWSGGWLTGDPISGPLTENFGPGIENVQIKLKWSLGRVFTHTQYWSLKAEGKELLKSGLPGERSHLDVLRDAVDLGRKLES